MLILQKPIYGLCLCIIIAPFWDLQYLIQLPLRLSAFNVLYLMFLISIYMNQSMLSHRSLDYKHSNIIKFMVLLLLLYLISGIRTYINPPEYYLGGAIDSISNGFIKPMIYLSLYFIIQKYFNTKHDIKLILNSMYIGLCLFFLSLITALFGIYGSWAWEDGVGPSGLFTEPIPAGTFLLVSFPFILVMYFEKFHTYLGKNKLLLILIGAAIFVLFSATRSLYIIFPLMILWIIYNSTKKSSKVILFLLLCFIGVLFMPKYALDRLKGNFIEDNSLVTVENNYEYVNHYINGRLKISEYYINIISSQNITNVLFGTGYKKFHWQKKYTDRARYNSYVGHPPNTFLEIILNIGIIGLIIYCILIFNIFRFYNKCSQSKFSVLNVFGRSGRISIVFLMIMGLVNNVNLFSFQNTWFWIWLGITEVLYNNYNEDITYNN